MPSDNKTRRDHLTLEAIDPADGGRCEVHLSYERIQYLGRLSKGHTMECAKIVPHVLQHPTSIFEGLKKESDEDKRGVGWRCYCGLPLWAFDRDGTERNAYPNRVFLVFVNDAGVAYNWRWEEADGDNPKLPSEHQDRFTRRVL